MLICAAPGVPVLGPSGSSAHLRGIAGALGPAAIVAARKVDHRGKHGAVAVPMVEVGVPGWPSWLGPWREYTEVVAARRVARAAALYAPDLVWERHSLFSDAGWKIHAATGAKWVLEVNAPLVDERLRYETVRRIAWARSWERDVLLAAPRVIAVSAWLVDWLRSIGCKDVRYVPNGVVPVKGHREATRRALGLDGKLVFGFLGSMKPWHGVERLRELLEWFPEAVGLLVGDGPVKVDHPRILKVGQVTEEHVPHLVAAMDIGLAPYAADAPPWFCPLKILAYRAQGTPIVASDVGDCKAITGSGGTVGEDFVEAIRHWRTRCAKVAVRSWQQVVAEALA